MYLTSPEGSSSYKPLALAMIMLSVPEQKIVDMRDAQQPRTYTVEPCLPVQLMNDLRDELERHHGKKNTSKSLPKGSHRDKKNEATTEKGSQNDTQPSAPKWGLNVVLNLWFL